MYQRRVGLGRECLTVQFNSSLEEGSHRVRQRESEMVEYWQRESEMVEYWQSESESDLSPGARV